jgi:hypothetical protein
MDEIDIITQKSAKWDALMAEIDGVFTGKSGEYEGHNPQEDQDKIKSQIYSIAIEAYEDDSKPYTT